MIVSICLCSVNDSGDSEVACTGIFERLMVVMVMFVMMIELELVCP